MYRNSERLGQEKKQAPHRPSCRDHILSFNSREFIDEQEQNPKEKEREKRMAKADI